MVMFKAKFRPVPSDKPSAGTRLQRQQLQQQPRPQPEQKDKVPPIEDERGTQFPVREPGPSGPPERAR
jgi:hypothetical protein